MVKRNDRYFAIGVFVTATTTSMIRSAMPGIMHINKGKLAINWIVTIFTFLICAISIAFLLIKVLKNLKTKIFKGLKNPNFVPKWTEKGIFRTNFFSKNSKFFLISKTIFIFPQYNHFTKLMKGNFNLKLLPRNFF